MHNVNLRHCNFEKFEKFAGLSLADHPTTHRYMRPPPQKRRASTPSDAPRSGGAVFDGPHELWTTAASVLHRVLHGGSLKSLLAPMRSRYVQRAAAEAAFTLTACEEYAYLLYLLTTAN